MIIIFDRNSGRTKPDWIVSFSDNGAFYKAFARATWRDPALAETLKHDFMDAAFETLYAATPEGTRFEMVGELRTVPVLEIRFKIDSVLASEMADSAAYITVASMFEDILELSLETVITHLKAGR
ncbi:hypothetical protein L3V16_21240 [Brucella ciceri]|uniref:hypothetical protein n=1 Tax=Brucella ciceri TaxID=391287 RepID=UPI000DE45AE8|nr:hypothetical protein [Brucella ciceri]MCH6206352.1 hypothetical protein [Brucella ciceri]